MLNSGKEAHVRVPGWHQLLVRAGASFSSKQLSLQVLVAICCFMSAMAHGEEPQYGYFYDGTGYGALDEACHVAYDKMASKIISTYPPSSSYTVTVLPYETPTPSAYSVPPTLSYDCVARFQFRYSNGTVSGKYASTSTIDRRIKSCPVGQRLNPFSEVCEKPEDDQKRQEEGDPSTPTLGAVVTCAGNPVSVASGNKFQDEEDYRDNDGELRFFRFYNGFGDWGNSYGMFLHLDRWGRGAELYFPDGRASLFALSSKNEAVAEPAEQGSLKKINDLWVYTSPANEQFTFDLYGQLTKWQLADGRVQTLARTYDASGNPVVAVTDSLAHKLQLVLDMYSRPVRMTVGGLTVTYTYDAQQRLASATRVWPNRTTSRSYVYEDKTNPYALTGIIDERGMRYATWRYDAQGRAISSEHANGAEKVTLAYNSDGSTKVTNSLGNAVTYRYQVIQGVKRVTAVEGSPATGCPASNTRYTYTDRGQVATKTDALGVVTAYTYDAMGRETQRIEAKGTTQQRTITTTWDATRFLPTKVVTADHTTAYTYDAQGRLLTTTEHAN